MPSVFFSYKHESDGHKARVRDFADSLQALGTTHGVTVILDQHFAAANPAGPDQGWEIWSENQATKCDYVLVVASKQYHAGYNLNHPSGTAPGIIPEALIIRKRVRHEGYQPHTVRPLVLKSDEVEFVPDGLSHLNRFGITDVANVLKWIVGIGDKGNFTPTWFVKPPTFDQCLIADCNEVMGEFVSMLVHTSSKRVLLVRGDSGLGKTTLIGELTALVTAAPVSPLCAHLDLKGGFIERLLEPFARKVSLLELYLTHHTQPALTCLSLLFNALVARHHPLILFFDTFESGGIYAQWIEENVLPIAASATWLRVVVAGKEVPNAQAANCAMWRSVAITRNLRRLGWNDWRLLASKLRPELTDTDIQNLCEYACGNHHAIRAVLGVNPGF